MARKVTVTEVGPRDGLQNAHHLMPTEAKKAWIAALAAAGLKEIEVGSFVPPKLIPAMADTAEVVHYAIRIKNLKVVALAPNLKGFQRALEAGAHKITFPVSASRKHSESNVRMTPEQMVEEVRKCALLPHPGVEIRVSDDGRTSVLELAIPFEESDPRVDSAIETLRDDLVPATLGTLDGGDTGATYAVGGGAAESLDWVDRERSVLPLVIGTVLLLTLLVVLGLAVVQFLSGSRLAEGEA